jgi:hypothetical protein
VTRILCRFLGFRPPGQDRFSVGVSLDRLPGVDQVELDQLVAVVTWKNADVPPFYGSISLCQR